MSLSRVDFCRGAGVLLALALISLAGCREGGRTAPDTTKSATPHASSTARPAGSLVRENLRKRLQQGVPHPMGPALAVEAGVGIGPIRFGSNVASIERHMGMKCEELTEQHCRILQAGVEFELKDGVVSAMVVHRFERPVPGTPGKTWGTFAGGIPPNIHMLMVPEVVEQELGKPTTSVAVDENNPNRTVRRVTYPGLELEYDKNPTNGRLMLGGVRVVKKS